jgi:hypothetical protein
MTSFWKNLFTGRLIAASTEEASSAGTNHLKRYLSNTLLMGLAYGVYSFYESHKESLPEEKVKKHLNILYFMI